MGAFQYLTWKQFKHPKRGADRTNKLYALKNLSLLSKKLLCEIETAINNTGMKMPKVFSREEMNDRLTFQNNGKNLSFDPNKIDDICEMDMQFAKVRFGEYLHALQQMLRNRRAKHNHQQDTRANAQLSVQAAKNSSTVNKAVHAADVTELMNHPKVNHPRKNLRKSLRPKQHVHQQYAYAHAQHDLHYNRVDSNISATNRLTHRPLHRKRLGQGKKRRMQKQSRNGVAGVGTNAMKLFRRNQRKSTVSPILVPKMSTTTTTATATDPNTIKTTTTTVAPHT